MNDSPISASTPLPEGAGWPWSPGVRLVRRLERGGRWLLLLLVSLLPLVALGPGVVGWPGVEALPRAAAAALALPALYFWACTWLARRDRREAAPVVDPSPKAEAAADASGEPAATVNAPAGPDAVRSPAAGLAASSEPAPAPEPPAAGPGQPPAGAPADLRACHAEIRMATDEIARRTVALAGMLDACSQAMDSAVAELDALQDEERVAQKVLVTLRARLLALDHRNHALMRTALAGNVVADDPGALEKAVQAAEAQVLHCHQLSERLGAAERGAARHVESLRRVSELLSHHAQRGLRESQQLMVLTRRIGASLAAAEAQALPGQHKPQPPAD